MEARYGKKRRAAADRRLVIVLASVLFSALLIFIVWAAFAGQAKPTGTIVGFTTTNSHSVLVEIQVNNPSNKLVYCQVSATNSHDSSVGSVQIALNSGQTLAQKVRIITVEPAIAAVVDSCWNR